MQYNRLKNGERRLELDVRGGGDYCMYITSKSR